MVGKSSPIGIFDSGLGGLTVFKAIRSLMPKENIIYFGDTARVPYGTKSRDAVIAFSREIAGFLSARHIKLLIVACNTASSLALEEVRRTARVPVIGVIEPGAKAAVASAKGKKILVTGTTATVSSGAYRAAIRKLDPSAKVIEKACPLFVPLVEEGWCDTKVTSLVAAEYLSGFKKKNIDTVILGCTHYPLIKKIISRTLGGIKVVDSAEVTALEARENLAARELLRSGDAGASVFYASDAPQKFRMLARKLLRINVDRVAIKRF